MMIDPHFLRDSPLDSRRFGIRVVRGIAPPSAPDEDIVDAIRENTADLVILRTESGNSAVATRLQQLGQPVIRAGTLVYYAADLTLRPASELASDVRLATPADAAAVRDIAGRAFCGYRSHYNANPLLPQDRILAGYVEWAESRLGFEDSGACTWVITSEGCVAGFLSCDLSRDAGKVEIVLNAVHPAYTRRGLYGRLLTNVLNHYARQSYRRLVTSTQLWNYTVQRQWIRANLLLERARDTYHIDRRLHVRETAP